MTMTYDDGAMMVMVARVQRAKLTSTNKSWRSINSVVSLVVLYFFGLRKLADSCERFAKGSQLLRVNNKQNMRTLPTVGQLSQKRATPRD